MGQNQVRAGTNGKRWFGALVLGWIAAGCARDPVRLVEPDPARTGEPGVDGPYGVARLDLRVPARVTDAIPVAVVYPADDALGPAVAGAPAVVFVHGGGVVPDRYVWLASHLATRGYAVVLPEAWLDLAIFEPGNGALALDALREASEPDGRLPGLVDDDGPVAVAGHSLGGVMAARQWVRDDSIDGLVLLASYAAGSDDVEGQGDRPVLALGGTEDGLLPPDQLTTEVARFADPVWFGLVDGLNHFGWTDDPTDRELAGDHPAIGDLDGLRTAALTAIDRFVDAELAGGDESGIDAPIQRVTWQ